MKEKDLAEKLNLYRVTKIPQNLRLILSVFIVVGGVVLLGGFLGVESQRVFQAYLVNFAFWTGIAQAAVAFAAVYRLTNAKWSDEFRRIGELFVVFLPISFIMLFLILAVQSQLYPWIDEPIPKKAAWLNSPFFTVRMLFYIGIMTALSIYYVYLSVRPDVGLIREHTLSDSNEQRGISNRLIEFITHDWKGYSLEYEKSQNKLRVLTPIFILVFGVLYTFVGFDLLMTLDPHWFSTLYGWLFVISAFYSAIVAIMIVGYFVKSYSPVREQLSRKKFHDIGKLMLGFCMFTGGLVWSEYLTIWYGNIPEETAHIIVRYHEEPWAVLSTAVIILAYFIPFIFLLSRKIKETPAMLFTLGVLIMAALWANRFVQAVPSIWHENFIPFGFIEVGITAGFFGVFVLVWLWFAKVVPLAPGRLELKSNID